MTPLELALENFFNNYRYTPGVFDSLQEWDIFVAEEVMEVFFHAKHFNLSQATAFLTFLSRMPRIQWIMNFKMPTQKIMSFLEEKYSVFVAQVTPQRVHRTAQVQQTKKSSKSSTKWNKVAY